MKLNNNQMLKVEIILDNRGWNIHPLKIKICLGDLCAVQALGGMTWKSLQLQSVSDWPVRDLMKALTPDPVLPCRGLRSCEYVNEEGPSEHQADQQRVPSHPGQGRVGGHHGVRHGCQVLQRERWGVWGLSPLSRVLQIVYFSNWSDLIGFIHSYRVNSHFSLQSQGNSCYFFIFTTFCTGGTNWRHQTCD